MADRAWKAWERRLAKWFPNAQRRGADFRSEDAGKSDLICDGWSVEAKLYKRPTWGVLMDAALQAERNRPHPTDIPVAVVKKFQDDDKNALVIMRLEEFAKYFINSSASGEV